MNESTDGRRTASPSWPALCRPSTPWLPERTKGVDGRHKAGHDGGGKCPATLEAAISGRRLTPGAMPPSRCRVARGCGLAARTTGPSTTMSCTPPAACASCDRMAPRSRHGRSTEQMDGGADARRITIYAPEDFAGMRAAGRLAAETLDMITPHVRPGRDHRHAGPALPRLHHRPRRGSGAAELSRLSEIDLHLDQPRGLPRHSRASGSSRTATS